MEWIIWYYFYRPADNISALLIHIYFVSWIAFKAGLLNVFIYFFIMKIVQKYTICSFVQLQHNVQLHYTPLTALFPGLPRWSSTRKVKPISILLTQETVSGSGISWAICKYAPLSRQITMPAPRHSVFYRPGALLPPNQQHQCTEGINIMCNCCIFHWCCKVGF